MAFGDAALRKFGMAFEEEKNRPDEEPPAPVRAANVQRQPQGRLAFPKLVISPLITLQRQVIHSRSQLNP